MAKKAATRNRRPRGAPAHLSDEAAGIWDKTRLEWGIDDRASLSILTTGLEAFDRMRQAQKKIKEQDITGPDRFGQLKPNPACAIERDSRDAFLRSMRQLGIGPDDTIVSS